MTKKFGPRILILIFINVLFLIAVGNLACADPIVGDILVTPSHPAPLSDVTFSVEIEGNDISSVRLIVRECNKETGICHAPPQNVSMSNVGGNTYKAEVTLIHDDVTSITYNIEIKSEGKWIESDESTTTLNVKSEDTDSNGNDSNDTPEFEILAFLVAVICVVMILKRKRSK